MIVAMEIICFVFVSLWIWEAFKYEKNRQHNITRSVIFSAALLIIIALSSCSSRPVGQKYAVRKIEHVSGNRYIVSTDSFKVVRHVRGIGKYKPDSVTKKLITNE